MMREFATGATRDSDEGKLKYAGFLSSMVLESYAQYMHVHRKQADGKMREPDNWKNGIPTDTYMDCLWRHFMDVYKMWENGVTGPEITESINACLFNLMGYQYELLSREKNLKQHRQVQLHGGDMDL